MPPDNYWFYQEMGSAFGPINHAQLAALVAEGKITSETKVRMGDNGVWMSAGELPAYLLMPRNARLVDPDNPYQPPKIVDHADPKEAPQPAYELPYTDQLVYAIGAVATLIFALTKQSLEFGGIGLALLAMYYLAGLYHRNES